MSGGGFTLVDFTIPTREVPIAHPGAQAPLCDECRSQDLCFFDPNCFTCQDILLDQKTSISELFAVMRQWVPQTQKNMTSLTREVLRRGANVNDRDDLTDLTLLHYASKSGAVGVGNETSAANLVKNLISKGANTEMRCRWTNMNAMHYAVFFDAPEVVDALAEQTPSLVMGACSEFNNGNSLHIAAANLSLESAKILVKHEADGTLKDDNGRLPYECIPESVGKEQVEIAEQLRELLKSAAENPPPKSRLKQVSSLIRPSPSHSPTPPVLTPSHKARNSALQSGTTPERRSPVSREAAPSPKGIATVKQSSRTQSPLVEEVTMATLGVKVGDRIIIDASTSKPKYGTIRYGGTTEFQPGQWAGIELDEAIGKNDGSCGGIRYFTCKPKYGLFVPMHRISKAMHQHHERRKKTKETKSRDSLAATNKAIDAQAQLQMNTELQVGDRVVVGGSRTGVLRFAGAVKFAPGFWLGVELDNSHGKNDGSVDSVRYFQCRPKYGVFVPPSRVKRHTGSQLSAPRSSASSSSTHASASSGGETTDSSSLPSSSLPSSLVSSGVSGSSDDALATSPSPHASPRSPRRRGTPSSNKSSNKSSTPTSRTKHLKVPSVGTPSPTPLSLATAADPVLEEGMSVLVSKEMGVVRFIGTTEFADGVWLGIELRKPNGKNDGSVKGKRYFTCKPSYGLFVRPEKASYRGINCGKLLQNKSESSKT